MFTRTALTGCTAYWLSTRFATIRVERRDLRLGRVVAAGCGDRRILRRYALIVNRAHNSVGQDHLRQVIQAKIFDQIPRDDQ